jgi:hypothetical protein
MLRRPYLQPASCRPLPFKRRNQTSVLALVLLILVSILLLVNRQPEKQVVQQLEPEAPIIPPVCGFPRLRDYLF